MEERKIDLTSLENQEEETKIELTDDEVDKELGINPQIINANAEHDTSAILDEDEITPRRRRSRMSNSEIATATYEELDQLIDEMDPGSTKRVYMTLTRVEPSHWAGQRIEGYICKYSHKTNIDEIKQTHGGGTYDIRFFGPRRNGKGNELITSRRIVISGDPILQKSQITTGQTSVEAQIVKDAMNTQRDVMARMEEKNRQDQQAMMNMMKEFATKGGDQDSLKLIMGMFQTMAEQQRIQLEAIREEAKRDRELMIQREREREAENRRRDERHQEELRQIRAEAEKIKQSTSSEMMQFVKEMGKDRAASTEAMTKQLQVLSEMQLKMVMENSKHQMDMILSENKRLSDELKESRLSTKTDLASELKKMATVFDMMESFRNLKEGETPSLADKIGEHLPDIIDKAPDIIQSFGGLFRGTRPQVTPRPPPSMPHRRLVAPRQTQQQQQKKIENETREEHHKEEQNVSEIKETQEKIIALKSKIDDAITNGISPQDFFNNNISGKFDQKFLQRVASAPPGMLISAMGQMFGQDGPLFSVRGKDYMHDLHRIIRESLPA
jgi:hypothetical protein